ncbi:hypothetical protein [Streptomyces virginiae]|uniref:hypothetical protein n=1 Tax=Streptomyces virginiae TaxID=1961 RepID=UPI001FE8A0B7|nr:hypothetical protein [Streptomyces virginiae]
MTVSSQAAAPSGPAAGAYHSTRASSSRSPASRRAAYHVRNGTVRHTVSGTDRSPPLRA